MGYKLLFLKIVPIPIMDEAEYQRQLQIVEELMKLEPTKARSQMIGLLATLICDFEVRLSNR
jgi:hypothetical protein